MGPKSFSRVSKSVHGHSKSATCSYYFCNILFFICFNILPLNAEKACLLYTSDAADEEDSVDLGGRRIIKKKILQK